MLTGDGPVDLFRGQRVNSAFFDTLGVRPFLGRLFTAEEDRAPRADVVILSYELWATRFGADRSVVGRVYTMNGAAYRVIGVLGRDFHPLRMSNPAEEPRIYAPLGYDPGDAARCRNCAMVSAIGTFADGASAAAVRNEVTAASRWFRNEYPSELTGATALQVTPLKEHLTGALYLSGVLDRTRGSRLCPAHRVRQSREPAA